jgi:hypothetical protein
VCVSVCLRVCLRVSQAMAGFLSPPSPMAPLAGAKGSPFLLEEEVVFVCGSAAFWVKCI